MHRRLELVDAAVGHRHLLVLLNLLGSVRSDTVYRRSRRVHFLLHSGRGLVPRLRMVDLALLLLLHLGIGVQVVRLSHLLAKSLLTVYALLALIVNDLRHVR